MDCIHYWLIPPANGPTVIGTCKYCGAIKELLTCIDDKLRKNDYVYSDRITSERYQWD